ncbi:hypothetical protein [Rhodococcus pyridinivorans]|uniref:hypothetical protein n=1 Tax=Rhodococcus pyridinivorans TaxID=103816 RepID=UPI0019072B7A|nr:hypothetical protein [Rhodococcus pyridinivorans]QQM52596.1 hypothetical protein JGU70_19195 [Rhodococcus pyridinivorans]
MNLVVYALYTLALLFQLAGAALVVMDVTQSQRNMDAFKGKLDEAKEAREEHLRHLELQNGRTYPGFGGGVIRGPSFPTATRELFADQLGPRTRIEREALTDFVSAQYSISKRRRWTGVGFLVIGTVAGYAGSMLSVA